MVYSLSGNKYDLKSQFGEIGRLSCIFGFFPILSLQNGGGAYRIGKKSFVLRR